MTGSASSYPSHLQGQHGLPRSPSVRCRPSGRSVGVARRAGARRTPVDRDPVSPVGPVGPPVSPGRSVSVGRWVPVGPVSPVARPVGPVSPVGPVACIARRAGGSGHCRLSDPVGPVSPIAGRWVQCRPSGRWYRRRWGPRSYPSGRSGRCRPSGRWVPCRPSGRWVSLYRPSEPPVGLIGRAGFPARSSSTIREKP